MFIYVAKYRKSCRNTRFDLTLFFSSSFFFWLLFSYMYLFVFSFSFSFCSLMNTISAFDGRLRYSLYTLYRRLFGYKQPSCWGLYRSVTQGRNIYQSNKVWKRSLANRCSTVTVMMNMFVLTWFIIKDWDAVRGKPLKLRSFVLIT